LELGNVELGLTDGLIDRREKSVNGITGMSGWSSFVVSRCVMELKLDSGAIHVKAADGKSEYGPNSP